MSKRIINPKVMFNRVTKHPNAVLLEDNDNYYTLAITHKKLPNRTYNQFNKNPIHKDSRESYYEVIVRVYKRSNLVKIRGFVKLDEKDKIIIKEIALYYLKKGSK